MKLILPTTDWSGVSMRPVIISFLRYRVCPPNYRFGSRSAFFFLCECRIQIRFFSCVIRIRLFLWVWIWSISTRIRASDIIVPWCNLKCTIQLDTLCNDYVIKMTRSTGTSTDEGYTRVILEWIDFIRESVQQQCLFWISSWNFFLQCSALDARNEW